MEIEGRGPKGSSIESILMEKALEILEISMKYGGRPIQWDTEKKVACKDEIIVYFHLIFEDEEDYQAAFKGIQKELG